MQIHVGDYHINLHMYTFGKATDSFYNTVRIHVHVVISGNIKHICIFVLWNAHNSYSETYNKVFDCRKFIIQSGNDK